MNVDKKFKKWVKERITTRPWCYSGSLSNWINMWVLLMKKYADDGEYEIAQCIKESIIELINDNIPEKERVNEKNVYLK